jgi:hypothetical protein
MKLSASLLLSWKVTPSTVPPCALSIACALRSNGASA